MLFLSFVDLTAAIGTAAVPSEETIKAVTKLLEAVGQPVDVSVLSAGRIHALSEITSTIIWPAVLISVIILFRNEIRELIKRIRKVGIGGTSFEAAEEIQKRITSSSNEALSSSDPKPSSDVSSNEIRRSVEVAALSREILPEITKAQIDQIAAEYEGIRANLPSGSARTKQMGAVMAKMRTLGRTVYPLRRELANSPSPGRRLFAIAALQMLPDYELVDWLAKTTKTETPFMQYQALFAMLVAVRNAGPQVKVKMLSSIATAKQGLSISDPDTSRIDLARSIEDELALIPDPSP